MNQDETWNAIAEPMKIAVPIINSYYAGEATKLAQIMVADILAELYKAHLLSEGKLDDR